MSPQGCNHRESKRTSISTDTATDKTRTGVVGGGDGPAKGGDHKLEAGLGNLATQEHLLALKEKHQALQGTVFLLARRPCFRVLVVALAHRLKLLRVSLRTEVSDIKIGT